MSETHRILKKEILSETIKLFVVQHKLLAQKAKAGQFVIVRLRCGGERIPLTIADSDPDQGTITLVIQEVGKTTTEMGQLSEGDSILDLMGPLGHPSNIQKWGTVLCIAGGLGIAPLYPVTRALKRAGNTVISILGARNQSLIFWEDKMKAVSDELIVTTDDGSYGRKGLVTEVQKELMTSRKIDKIYSIGPGIMMKFVVETSRPFQISTIVSLNTVMVDGTGMCGGCRVQVNGKSQFVCVDGPEFEGLDVDFDNLLNRQKYYQKEEKQSVKVVRVRAKQRKTQMPTQDPKVRITNFNEVALGYTEEMAIQEASRCLHCKKPKCIQGCPVNVNIPDFIQLIKEKKFIEASQTIKTTNALPAICGRVCPQEIQCEKKCIVGIKNEPVAIGRLERFVADHERNFSIKKRKKISKNNNKKVAIIGAGPAGLTCAADCAKAGFSVVIFEAFHRSGGVLVYGIPEFRLPKDIVRSEIKEIKKLGVEIKLNTVAGRLVEVQELLDNGFCAVFIGVGAGLPVFMHIPGENLSGVYSANEFLTRVNLMKAYEFPNTDTPIRVGTRIAVVGGGNVAIDAARAAKRFGKTAYLIYRRSEAEMPARTEEVHHAKEEGIHFMFQANPVEILGNEKGLVTGIKCVKMVLGLPDDSGRRKPLEIKGSEFVLEADSVIMALGNKSNPLLTQNTQNLNLNRFGNIEVLDESGATSIENVWAGGDIVTGAATVIEAMGAGKKAAQGIIEKFGQ